jgi:hypothetical protein
LASTNCWKNTKPLSRRCAVIARYLEAGAPGVAQPAGIGGRAGLVGLTDFLAQQTAALAVSI